MSKDKNLSVRIDEEKLEQFKTVADTNGTKMSKLIEDFIDKTIAESKKSNKEIDKINISKKVGNVLEALSKYNSDNGFGRENPPTSQIYGLIVFSNKSFDKEYPFESRAYYFSSDNKYFLSGMIGNSIFGYSLDGTDMGIRIEQYKNEWVVEDCYLIEFKGDKVYTLDGEFIGIAKKDNRTWLK